MTAEWWHGRARSAVLAYADHLETLASQLRTYADQLDDMSDPIGALQQVQSAAVRDLGANSDVAQWLAAVERWKNTTEGANSD